jgi:hypothetical protein
MVGGRGEEEQGRKRRSSEQRERETHTAHSKRQTRDRPHDTGHKGNRYRCNCFRGHRPHATGHKRTKGQAPFRPKRRRGACRRQRW